MIDIVQSIAGKGLSISNRLRTKDKVDNKFKVKNLLNEIGNYPFTPLNKGIERTYYALMKNNDCSI